MFRLLFRGALALVVLLVLASALPIVAFAADTAPETVAQATTDSNRFIWAYGASVTQWAQAVAYVIASGLMFMLTKLVPQFVAAFGNVRAQTLIQNAVGYAINSVAGAVQGKTLEFNVSNDVVRKALVYALENAPKWLESWAGGPMGIAKKIVAHLPMPAEFSDEKLPTIVASAVSDVAASK